MTDHRSPTTSGSARRPCKPHLVRPAATRESSRRPASERNAGHTCATLHETAFRPHQMPLRPTVISRVTPKSGVVTRPLAPEGMNGPRRRTAVQIEMLLAELEDERVERHTLGEAIERYRLEHLLVDDLATNTIAWRESTCARLKDRFGDRDLEGRWRDAAAALYRDLSRTSASMCCNTLGRILNLARTWGWRSAEHDLKGLCRIRSNARERVLVLRERVALHAALEHFDTPRTHLAAEVVRFVLHTGWRVTEAVGIEWANVAEGFDTVYLPTTKAGPQTRAIGPEASAVLERQPSRFVSPWVFPARRGDRAVNRRQPEQVMTEACRRAGIHGASLHTLRHTRATVSAQLQLPTTSVALALGHTTEYQTSRYQHVNLDDVRAAAAVVDEAMTKVVRHGGGA